MHSASDSVKTYLFGKSANEDEILVEHGRINMIVHEFLSHEEDRVTSSVLHNSKKLSLIGNQRRVTSFDKTY